jgi:hypothetical protein
MIDKSVSVLIGLVSSHDQLTPAGAHGARCLKVIRH